MSHNNKKISELPDATLPITTGVKFEAVQGGINVKVDADDMPGSGGGGAVDSVNGQTGVVVLDAGDVGADPAGSAAAAESAANTYSDGKVADAINNGTTTVAPSQNAVFDALALKSDILSTFRTLTSDHTLDATDLANVNTGDVLEIQMNVAIANSVTIPANATQAFPVGTNIIISQIGAGQTSMVAAVGVTINSANGWVKIAYQYASVVITKTATNTWSIKGTLAA